MEEAEGGIRAITFDVGGTLAEGKPDHKLYAQRVLSYLSSLGFAVKEEEWRKATSQALSQLRLRREEGLEMSFQEFSSLQLSGVGVEPREELLREMLSLYLSSFPRRLKRGARRVVEELAGSYGLGAISNSMSPAPKQFLMERGLGKYFRTILVSGEVGYRKPHPEIFFRALRELGVPPQEAVHVGDRSEIDGKGAKGVGMRFILLSPHTPRQAEADAVVPSIREVPGALKMLSQEEELASLGKECFLCSSPFVSLYEFENGPVLLCPDCRRGFIPSRVRPRKHGKYRAVYRKSWRQLWR